jgi:ribosomal-protein-alanine N-acetyltransferase
MEHYIYQDNLETERLVTRKLTPDDIPLWAGFFADKEATQFLSTFADKSNLERAAHMIGKQLDRYTGKRFGLQALIDKKSNVFIGQCGLLAQEVEGKREIEVGYHVFKKYWGQGYAPEAARLFIDYAFTNKLASSVISIIDVNNSKSQKVAAKNGLAIDKKIKWQDGEEVYIYRIHK